MADLGHGESRPCPLRRSRTAPTADERTVDPLHAATGAPAERGSSLLDTTSVAPHHVSLRPGRIGTVTAAALVLLHREHDRTT